MMVDGGGEEDDGFAVGMHWLAMTMVAMRKMR